MSMLYVAAVATWAGTEPLTGWAARGLVVFPCILWLTYIYRQDRLEPEPWQLLAAVALLGAVMTAVALPWLRPHAWRCAPVRLWGQGLVRAVCVVAALFLWCGSAFATAEFDEPVDALVCAAAAAAVRRSPGTSPRSTPTSACSPPRATLAVATTPFDGP